MRTHTLLLTLTLAAAALANPVDRRPPPLLPQRADTLILGGAGTPEAGSLDSMPALRKFGCSGNACDDGARKGNALASKPASVSYSPAVDAAYVGHATPAGSAVEGGAFDAAGVRVASAAPPHGGGSSLFVGLGGADAVTSGTAAAWQGDSAKVEAAQAKAGQVGAATPAATTSTDAAVDATTLAQATTTPTTSFPTAGQHATTEHGGVATAGGEITYTRGDRALAAAAPAALDALPKPPAPRGPAGALAATALAAVGGAAASVSASAGAAVPKDAPPADDAEAFSMAVRDVAAGVAGRLGASPRKAGPQV